MSFEKDVLAIRETLNEFEIVLTEALLADGIDQKQYYIEQVLSSLMGSGEFEKKKNRVKWQDGTPPPE